MTVLAVLTTIAGPLCAVIVGLLFAALATLTLGMPASGQDVETAARASGGGQASS